MGDIWYRNGREMGRNGRDKEEKERERREKWEKNGRGILASIVRISEFRSTSALHDKARSRVSLLFIKVGHTGDKKREM